jgi:hypothetical protein
MTESVRFPLIRLKELVSGKRENAAITAGGNELGKVGHARHPSQLIVSAFFNPALTALSNAPSHCCPRRL